MILVRNVYLQVIRESGPPHMKTFVTVCQVGEFVTEAEGNSKKVSKKRAAELMLDDLRKLPPLPSSTLKPKLKQPNNKKKNRNIIKVCFFFIITVHDWSVNLQCDHWVITFTWIYIFTHDCTAGVRVKKCLANAKKSVKDLAKLPIPLSKIVIYMRLFISHNQSCPLQNMKTAQNLEKRNN